MIPPLGVTGTSIATPFTEEALKALENSELIRNIEVSPKIFDCDNSDAMIDAFFECVDKKGIGTPTYHAVWGIPYDLSSTDEAIRQEAIANFYGELSYAARLRSNVVVLHPSYEPISDEERPMRIKALRLSLSEVEERIRKYGFRIAIELLPRTCLGNTPEELLQIVEDFGEEFGFCLDVNHMMSNIGGIPDAVRKLSGRLYNIHVSDYMGVDECHYLPGLGKIDWKAFCLALNEIDYSGAFTFEAHAEGNPLERIRRFEEVYKTIFLN